MVSGENAGDVTGDELVDAAAVVPQPDVPGSQGLSDSSGVDESASVAGSDSAAAMADVANESSGEVVSESPQAESGEAVAEDSESLDADDRVDDVGEDLDEEVNEFGFTAAEMAVDDDDEEEEGGDENASPIEEFVEAEVPVEDDLDMRWYILKVQVNREKSICEALIRRVKQAGFERYFGDILVPTEDVRDFSKSGKQRIVKRKLYPGYVVVRMSITDDTWFLVRETPGIGDFTGAAGKPAPLQQEEIDRIIATTKPVEDEDGEEPAIKTAIKFKVGDRVRVKEGYFQNYEGEVSNIDERNGRVTVMINIFGRPNPVELDHWQVEDL